MNCPHCGKPLEAESRFCPHCGGKLVKSQHDSETKGLQSTNGDTDAPEESLWEGTYSKLAMIGAWSGGGIISLASVTIALFGGLSGAAWLAVIGANVLLWAVLAARYFYLRFSRHYTLTSQRFTHVRGLLWRQTDRIEVIDIDDVTFTQGPVERMFGIGTVRITSSDLSHPDLTIQGIENVQVVAGQIDDARRKERRRRGLYIESV